MSQEDDDFMYDDDEEYDLDYSTESDEGPDVDLENQYYKSKAYKEEDLNKALDSFQKLLDLEGNEKGEWGFKALKQMIKIHFERGHFERMMQRYKQLLTYIKSAVTRNYSEKSINSILDHISSATIITNASPGPYSLLEEPCNTQEQQDRLREQKDLDLLQEFYQATLQALKEAKNERLWFKTNTKLGKLYFDRGDYGKIFKIIRQLHQSCQTDDGEDDLKKGTQLLEIYALEIQVHTAQKNDKKLKSLYESCLHIKSAIPHPLIMGVIRECGGKMHLREHEFERAHTDFFEAFKNYDESGSPRRMACLKYLVLANMLMKSGINPFDSQEAKPYKNDPEVTAMTDLVTAYQNDDIVAFEGVLKRDRDKRASTTLAPGTGIMDDPFIREHVRELLRNVRTQVLLKLVQPYTRVRIDFIARRLNVEPGSGEVEELLIALILDGTLPRGCRIDQIDGILELVPHHSETGPSQSQTNATDKALDQVFNPNSPHYNGDRECTKQYLDVDVSKYCAIQRLTDRLAEFQQILFNKVV